MNETRKPIVGIRREDKSVWERRVPIVPQDAKELKEEHDLRFLVQPSDTRVFREEEYTAAGALIQQDLSPSDVIVGVKEIPPTLLIPGKTYVFFAHVIKGQPYNMPMLQRLMDLRATLIDYEKVTDEQDRRLIFFGRHAGWAGMIDTLWALGQRLNCEQIETPFNTIRQAYAYDNLDAAREAVRQAGDRIRDEGLPTGLAPLVVGFAGYGNVSQGAQDIFDLLPHEVIEPDELAEVFEREPDPHTLYKVIFKEEHMVESLDPDRPFVLQDYYDYPERYRSRFADYLPYLTVLLNGIYWEEKYPRLVTKEDLRRLFRGPEQPRMRVVGDVSCDVGGAIEFNVQCTEPGDPIYVYNPLTGEVVMGCGVTGVVVLAVDILPSELPREASIDFSAVLKQFLPAIAHTDYDLPFGELDLPPEIRRAVILHRGKLTPDYEYLSSHLEDSAS
jgi:alpha-aminoadipic semialdehyde synthase